MNSNFKGVNWSTRLWQDMALVQKKWKQRRAMYYLEGDILMSMYLSLKKTNSTTYNASRLLVTESARVQAESQKLTYLKN